MFVHSDRVLNLPEYRPQSTYMEEGGLLGFGLIELFSYIPQAGIRVPIVTTLLLFLLLNVAAIGFLFVYEVARILFLDIQDISGWGGIRLADSRLLRAEPIQQANVLNFCFQDSPLCCLPRRLRVQRPVRGTSSNPFQLYSKAAG